MVNSPVLYHGGISGLQVGAIIKPSPPHVTDGCLICVARFEGRTVTAGQYRAWAQKRGPVAQAILEALEGADDGEIIDAPSKPGVVFLTPDVRYATWYAARSGHGDVYEVEPVGDSALSQADHIVSYEAPAARVRRVIRRRVYLDRRERRELQRVWGKADRKSSFRSTSA